GDRPPRRPPHGRHGRGARPRRSRPVGRLRRRGHHQAERTRVLNRPKEKRELMLQRYPLQTEGNHAYDIQPMIDEAVKESGVTEGLVTIVAPHTTAALGIISYHD